MSKMSENIKEIYVLTDLQYDLITHKLTAKRKKIRVEVMSIDDEEVTVFQSVKQE